MNGTSRARGGHPPRVRLLSCLIACACTALLGASSIAGAQAPARDTTRQLSLADALRLAESQSPAIGMARAGVTRATGQRDQARSQYFPQVNGSAGYTKTLASQFSGVSFGGGAADTTAPAPPALCAPNIPADATPAERQAALAQAVTCPSANSGGFNFSSVGFGARNQWTLGGTLQQNLFTGGRLTGQTQAATAQLRSANVEVTAQRAQAALDVTQAYYDAILADQLVSIQDSSLAETEEVLRQTTVSHQVGNASDFDLLRATVTRNNQVPLLIQARSNREVAYLHLQQLLGLPLDQPLELTTAIQDTTAVPLPPGLATAPGDTAVDGRAPVREQEQAVLAQEGQLKVAKSERYPTLSLTSNYQRLYFPMTFLPNLNQSSNNWTIGLASTFPILDWGRIHGDELIAQAGVDQARAQLRQTRQLAALDTRVALNTFTQAQAAFSASQGNAEQAQRAYDIDQVRYREGLSTQTDLAQSRLLLEQARANQAQAARDLAVARMRLALIRDLPLQSAGGQSGAAGAAGGNAAAAGATQSQNQQQRLTRGAGGQTIIPGINP
jgi:outer membrane protein TolC